MNAPGADPTRLDVLAPMPVRCGIDSVEISRIDRLLAETPTDDLAKIFSPGELADAGDGPGRSASLARSSSACALGPHSIAGAP